MLLGYDRVHRHGKMRCQICQTMVNSVSCSHLQDGLSGKWTASDFGFQMAAHCPMFSGGSGGATQFKLGFAGARKFKQKRNILPVDYPVIVMVDPRWENKKSPTQQMIVKKPHVGVPRLAWDVLLASRLKTDAPAEGKGGRLPPRHGHSIASPKTSSKSIGFLPGCRWNVLWPWHTWYTPLGLWEMCAPGPSSCSQQK